MMVERWPWGDKSFLIPGLPPWAGMSPMSLKTPSMGWHVPSDASTFVHWDDMSCRNPDHGVTSLP